MVSPLHTRAVSTVNNGRIGVRLCLALGLIALPSLDALAANCTATYTHTLTESSSKNYNLNSGESLKVAAGTYSGSINNFSSTSTICVETGATFTPDNLNNSAGTLINYGTANLKTFSYSTGTVIDNYNTLSFTSGLNMNGATTIKNRTGATMNMAGSFQLSNSSTMTNDGTLVAQSDFNTQSGTTLTNNYRMELEGNFNPSGVVNNYGRVYAKKFININSGSTMTNYCSLVSYDGFNNNSSNTANFGYIVITTASGGVGGALQNNATFYNYKTGTIAGGDFTNNSTFSTAGALIFSGTTRNQGAFTGTSTTETINFYDETQTGSQIFDYQNTAPTNTVRQSFTRPTALSSVDTCSTSYKAFAPPARRDYGDAPASYGSASQTVNSSLFMGTTVPDAESSAQFSRNAFGDDTTGTADEDGSPSEQADYFIPLFPILKVTATSYTVDIKTTNASSSDAHLVAWIDFDQNGTFDADEGTTVTVPANSYNAAIPVTWSTIPSDIKLGTTFIRLRLSADSSVTVSTPTGDSGDGEVEDFALAVAQAIPAESPDVTVVTDDTSTCSTKVFSDDFNDLVAGVPWGANNPTSVAIRNWDRSGGGVDTYAHVRDTSAYGYGVGMYFGNGAVRRISPAIPNGFTFDGNGRLTTTIDAIELRDDVDDFTPNEANYESDWGPNPVTLSRTFTTVAGKKYRVYFDAVPEPATDYNAWKSGIMRIDTPSGSAHFRAPGDAEGVKHYRIEFTATSTSSTISFVNYGHVHSGDDGWCQPTSIWGAWCTVGGDAAGKHANELIVDNVVVAQTSYCQPATISGIVYKDVNVSQTYDYGEVGIPQITVKLYNDNGTPAILTDDTLVSTTSTWASTGWYWFTDVDPKFTYRIEVDASDTDLPTNWVPSGATSLTNVSVTAGQSLYWKNFGFYLPKNGNISGKVFDDVNYGGGAGRSSTVSGATGVAGAVVEAYNASGVLVQTSTTASDGTYTLSNLDNGDYYVRVVNGNVKSSRSGSNGTELGIQTFRTNSKTAVTTEVGGRNPAATDAAANTTSLTLDTSTFKLSDGNTVQSLQPVTVTGNVTGVNFGFNFSTVVNTNDSGQGSLRQGITNINLLANTGLAQTGQNNTYGVDTTVTKEVLLFNIPSASDTLGRTDICGGSVCKITLVTALPSVTAAAIVDATTQPGYVAGSPGVPRIHIVPTTGLDARGFHFNYLATDSTLRGVAITGFRTKNSNRGLTVDSERTWIESNYIGITPAGVADANGNGVELQYVQSGTVGGTTAAKRNIISGNQSLGLFFNTGASGVTIQNNYFGTDATGVTAIPNGTAIDTESGSGIQILNNTIAGNTGNGIELGFSGGTGGVSDVVIQDNRIGVNVNGAALPNSGPGIVNYGGSSGHQIISNIIANNLGGGIRFYSTNVSNITMSQNSIYANTNLGIDLNNDGVTLNDANDTDTGANASVNFPILASATVLNNTLTVYGCAPAGATVELFEADVSTGGAATAGANKLGKTKDYGEGQTFLASFVEGGSLDSNTADCSLSADADGNTQTGMKAFAVALTKPSTLVVGDLLTTTATVTNTGTSEFAPVFAVTEPPSISGRVFEDVNYGGGVGRAFGTTGTAGVAGATIELYSSAGAFVATTTTASDGSYTLAGVGSGNYYVRVVNSTVKSTRSGATGSERAVQTFRTDGVTAVTNEVGGRNPSVADAAANTTSQTLNTSTFLLSGGGQVQTAQLVTVTAGNVSGVGFGFNFSTIVNTNDSGQGSLRQFILNSNTLAQSSLVQDLPTSLKTEYGSAKEVSIFMIPSTALSSGVAIFTPQTALPTSSKSSVAFDARTQTLNIGDTNAGTVGSTLSVGVQELTVSPVNRPEIAIDCSSVPAVSGAAEYCMTVSGTGAYVRGFAFYGSNTGTLEEPSAALHVSSAGNAVISQNLFGTLADGSEPVWAKQNHRMGLMVEGVASVTDNYFAYNGYGAVFSGTSAVSGNFTANQMNYNGPNLEKDALNGLEDGDSLAIWDGAQVVIIGNHMQNSRGNESGGNGNIDHGNLIEVAGAGLATITNNTLINGFTANVGVYDGSVNVTVTYNVITAARGTGSSPTGTGVLVNPEGANPGAVIISRNSIFANGGLGIDLDPGTQSQTGNRVTKNDAQDNDDGPNELLNFPFFTDMSLQYGKLVIAGCAPAGSTIEIFEADVSPGGTDAEGSNKFGNAKDYGEGQFYLTSVVEGSSADTDTATCGHLSDSDGNNNRGMAAFAFTLPIPSTIVAGDKITATATLAGVGTSEFSYVNDGIGTITYSVKGTVFEDTNYGGGAGRAYGTTGTKGINGATVELYDATTGELRRSTTTANNGTQDGAYTLSDVEVGSYYVRVINGTVKSTRTGGKTTEVGVQTFRTDGTTNTTAEVGGHHPAQTDAAAQQGASVLDTTTFKFKNGPMDGGYLQTLQPVTVSSGTISGVDFGFNFDTVVNTNDSGQGSLRRALLNTNLLGGDSSLAQTGLTAAKENLLWQLPTTDANYHSNGTYWSINLASSLPSIGGAVVLDGSLQAGFSGKPVIELLGNNAGTGVNGVTFASGSDGSAVRYLAINRFNGAGVYLNGSNSSIVQSNYIGVNPAGIAAYGNSGGGVLLSAANNNLIGGSTTTLGNTIANNTGAGVAVRTTSTGNAIIGNSIYSNASGLGIDLGTTGVTANDSGDTDTGANELLNFPEVQTNSFGTNGTKVVTYDFDLDVPAGDYRLEFFVNDARDPSDYGEGQTFIGYKNITHDGSGSKNFKGTFNAGQTVADGAYIAATLTKRTSTGFGSTSEFSGVKAGIDTVVCTSLITGTDANMAIDENATNVTLLEAVDSNGNPISYVISGGADASLFTLTEAVDGDTFDCTTLSFVSNTGGVITKSLSADGTVKSTSSVSVGDYEVPQDSDHNNVYDLQITATDAQNQTYVRNLSVTVLNVNEAPFITSAATATFAEDTTGQVLDISAQDPDGTTEGNGLSYSVTGGADAKYFAVDSSTGVLSFTVTPDYDAPSDADANNVYEVTVTVSDSDGATGSQTIAVSVQNNAADDGVKLQARAFLQGAYSSSDGLMTANLASQSVIPTTQPYNTSPFHYAGEETLSSIVTAATDGDAMVDWVLLDLRSDASTIVATRAVVLQRDGDLVDAQTGNNVLHFANLAAGNYYVSVRHRNHLAIMSANALGLSATAVTVDFTQTATAVTGSDARLVSGSVALMWAGDINGSNTVTANGPSNDLTVLLSDVLTSEANAQANTNYVIKGYANTDLNLDGKVLFSGPSNDASVIMGNIILHPANTGYASNYIVKGSLSGN